MTDTTTNPPADAAKRQAVAIRDWIKPDGNPVESGKEGDATGFRYIHLPTAKRLNPAYNPETDAAPAEAVFEMQCGDAGKAGTMLAIFGGLTLAGNVVNTVVNGPKGDPTANPIPIVRDRFAEIEAGTWTDRAAGGGGVRYDKDKLAQAIAQAKHETDPAPYLAKMANKVDAKTGAPVADDAKGAISYGAYALRNPAVKGEYDKLTGGGVDIASL